MSDNRNAEMITALAVLNSLTILFTALRVYVRIFISKNWRVDDTLLVITLILYTLWSVDRSMGLTFGTGRHIWDPQEDIPHALFTIWLGELLYIMTTITLRLSIAVFLLRICFRRAHKMVIYCTVAMVIVFSILYLFLAAFQCNPAPYFWNQFAGGTGTCMDKHIFSNASFAHSAISATADFVLGILPIWIIWELKMNLRTKISVGIVLSLGVIAGIGALIRIPYIGTLGNSEDFLYTTIDVVIWSSVEPALGIIAAAACVLRPLFKTFYDRSTQGTPDQQTSRGSKRKKSRTGSRSVSPEEGLEFGQKPAGLNQAQNVDTNRGHMVSNGATIALGKDKKVVAFIAKSVGGSISSQENLNAGPTGDGIQVQRTIEIIRTHNWSEEENRSRSTTSSCPYTWCDL